MCQMHDAQTMCTRYQGVPATICKLMRRLMRRDAMPPMLCVCACVCCMLFGRCTGACIARQPNSWMLTSNESKWAIGARSYVMMLMFTSVKGRNRASQHASVARMGDHAHSYAM
jgi:hypothetical protein